VTELLSTVKLSKRYGRRFALQDADVQIYQGDIYGLIGRNGAGKTTLLKLINSQIRATAGEIHMQGQRMAFGRPPMRIGALVESPGLLPDATAMDNMLFKCAATGQNKKGHAQQLLRMVELHDTGKKKAKQFSLGMKQRLAIALAMVNDPQLLLLDEPINGMDPQGIKDMRLMLTRINREMGVTILISSHILDELAKFATSYGIIKDGRVLRQFSRQQLEQDNRSDIEIISPEIDRVEQELRQTFNPSGMQRLEGDRLVLHEGVENSDVISRRLFDQRIYVSQFTVRHQSLEDYFMGLTGGGNE
jgi:ABC-type multidrug transport system ATPase subunit